MDWKLILDEKPPMGQVLVLYDPDADDFMLVLWDGAHFVGYDNHETHERSNLYWALLVPPEVEEI